MNKLKINRIRTGRIILQKESESNYSSEKELIFRTYKELKKLNNSDNSTSLPNSPI
jgi:hypothetical protein